MAMKGWPSCFVDIINGADVGMVRAPKRPGLTLESFEGLMVL